MNSIFAVSAALAAIEAKALQALATHGGPLGQQLTTSKALSVSPLYSGVIAVNVVGGSMAMLTLSMKVGQARKKYGVEYPTMYAEGKSKDAKAFNCVQRGHQQALETFPSFLALSLVGGMRHPALTTLAGAAWIIGRVKWAQCYAEGGPEARYNSQWSRFIWYSLICTIVMSGSTSLGVAGVL